MTTYRAFDSWAELLGHVARSGEVYYQAPLDRHPVRVKAAVRCNKVRVTPPSRDADPFTADLGHLPRFFRT